MFVHATFQHFLSGGNLRRHFLEIELGLAGLGEDFAFLLFDVMVDVFA
jgi:hypothetical protein